MHGALFVLVLAGPLAHVPESPAAGSFTRAEIQSAYLYNFLKFVTWPAATFADGTTPYTICLAGVGSPPTAFDGLNQLTAKSRGVEIRYLTEGGDPDICHVLFLDRVTDDRTEKLLAQMQGRPVLTVSTGARFAREGGMIGLVSEGPRITFEVNLRMAERAGLKISANMLEAGDVVDER